VTVKNCGLSTCERLKIELAEIKFLKSVSGHATEEQVNNTDIRQQLNVESDRKTE
jgi:hypothetical protein